MAGACQNEQKEEKLRSREIHILDLTQLPPKKAERQKNVKNSKITSQAKYEITVEKNNRHNVYTEARGIRIMRRRLYPSPRHLT